VDSFYFFGYKFSWISWVAQFTNLKPQRNKSVTIFFFGQAKAVPQIQVPTK